jgi:hypothetical protein
VFLGKTRLGWMRATFDPSRIKSRSCLYSPREGDFKRTEKGWVVALGLGIGDLTAIPEFTLDIQEESNDKKQD